MEEYISKYEENFQLIRNHLRNSCDLKFLWHFYVYAQTKNIYALHRWYDRAGECDKQWVKVVLGEKYIKVEFFKGLIHKVEVTMPGNPNQIRKNRIGKSRVRKQLLKQNRNRI